MRTSKGITLVVLPILFSCQGADVRERAARLPDPLTPCQAKYLLLGEEIAFDSEARNSVKKELCAAEWL